MRYVSPLTALGAVLALLLLASAPAVAKGPKSKNARGRAGFVRADDGVAKGKIDIEVKKDEIKLRLQAQKLTDATPVDFVLLDAAGDKVIRSEVDVSDGSAHVTLKSKDGDTYGEPPTAPGIDLYGKTVCVQVGGSDVLVGVVPDLDAIGGPKKLKAKAHEFGDDADGKVKIDWRQKDGRIRISIKTLAAAHLTGVGPGDEVGFGFHVEDEGTEVDDYFVVGTAEVDEDGKVTLKLRTDHGDPLPLSFLKDPSSVFGATLHLFIDADGNGEVEEVQDVLLPTP